MAAVTLSPATHQCCSSKNGVFSPTNRLMAKSARTVTAVNGKGMTVNCQAASIVADGVPDIERRRLMNLLLFGAIGLPAAGILAPYTSRPSSGSWQGSGTPARDEIGNNIIASEWLNTHTPGDRTLTHGLKEDPTYLIVDNDTTIAKYAINAVCTHLGCIVPWNTVEKKFMCSCHGSQYDNYGKVIKGPATLSLELALVDVDSGKVVFSPWVETDFRTS